jgi:uncharacterized protein YndB with AHSA1/START domain
VSANDLRLTKIPSVKVGMLIRRPPGEVFRAFADPALTTRFWFTKSTGPLVTGANVRWDWEMYGVSVNVSVKELEEDSRILFEWGDGADPTTVEWRFTPWEVDATYIEVTETGLSGDGDALASRAAESTGGFALALCAAKAWLEHDIALSVVRDRYPQRGGTDAGSAEDRSAARPSQPQAMPD